MSHDHLSCTNTSWQRAHTVRGSSPFLSSRFMWAEVLLAVLYILPATSAIETPVSLPELPQERLASLGGRFTSRSGSITSSLALPRPTWSPLVKHHVNLSDPSLLIVPTPHRGLRTFICRRLHGTLSWVA